MENQNKREAKNLNTWRDVVKTRHKDKNFRKTKMMQQDGFLIPERDLMAKNAMLKAAAKKLIERLGPKTKELLTQFDKKQVELNEKQVIAFSKYFLIEDFNLTVDEQDTYASLGLTLKDLHDEKYIKALNKLKEYRDLGFFR